METLPPKVETPTSPPSSSTKPEFHRFIIVSNIRNNVYIMLDMENDLYDIWVELLCIHTRSHQILQHIVPSENKPQPLAPDPNYD